jgi:MFS family permease
VTAPHLQDRVDTDARSHQAWTLVLVSLSLFMTALDTLVVTTALPVLQVSLHTSLSDLEWMVNAYNLAFACSLLTGAALGDRFGRRRVFCIGLSPFTVASAGSALAPTVGVLIATRALRGMGAAMVMPLSLTLISEAFPIERRGMASGLWGASRGWPSQPAQSWAAPSPRGSAGTGSSG